MSLRVLGSLLVALLCAGAATPADLDPFATPRPGDAGSLIATARTDSDPLQRNLAVFLLGQLAASPLPPAQHKIILTALADALADTEPFVVLQALRQLRRVPDRGAVIAVLQKRLSDPLAARRLAAVRALAAMGKRAGGAWPMLMNVSEDSDPAVRAEALRLLGRFAIERSNEDVTALVGVLLASRRHPSAVVREVVRSVLAGLPVNVWGQRALPLLENDLADPTFRLQALDLLQHIGEAGDARMLRAVAGIITTNAAGHPDPIFRHVVTARLCGLLGCPALREAELLRGLACLRGLLAGNDANHRESVLLHLAKFVHKRTLPAGEVRLLVPLLELRPVSASAMQALVTLAPTSPVCLAWWADHADRNPDCVLEPINLTPPEVLRRLGKGVLRPLADKLTRSKTTEDREHVLRCLRYLGPFAAELAPQVAHLMPDLATSGATVTGEALGFLATSGMSADQLRLLVQRYESKATPVRGQVRVAGRPGGMRVARFTYRPRWPDAVRDLLAPLLEEPIDREGRPVPLLALLEDANRFHRRHAASLLREHTADKATLIPALVRRLGDPDVETARYCGNLLVQIGAPAMGHLNGVLLGKDPRGKRQAVDLLVRMFPAAGVERALRQASRDADAEVRWLVAARIPRMGFLPPLDDPDPEVRAMLLRRLPELGDPAAYRGSILQATGDPAAAVREHAAHLLPSTGVSLTAALPALARLMRDEWAVVRSEAILALERLHSQAKVPLNEEEAGRITALLADRLADIDSSVRWRAFRGLGLLGPHLPARLQREAVRVVAAHRRSADRLTRRLAVATLAALGETPSASELGEVLLEWRNAEASWYVDQAVRGLVCCASLPASAPGEARQAARLLELWLGWAKAPDVSLFYPLLSSPHLDSRESARLLLKAHGPGRKSPLVRDLGPAVLPVLLQNLEGPRTGLRGGLLDALCELGPEARAAVPLLTRAFDNAEEMEDVVPIDRALAALWPPGWMRARLVSVPLPPRIPPPGILSLCRSLNARSAILLGQMGTRARPAIPLLAEALDSDDPALRFHAAEALLRLGWSRGVEGVLLGLLGQRVPCAADGMPQEMVGTAAARLLHGPAVLPVLRQVAALGDGPQAVDAGLALWRLGSTQSPSADVLAVALTGEDADLRRLAITEVRDRGRRDEVASAVLNLFDPKAPGCERRQRRAIELCRALGLEREAVAGLLRFTDPSAAPVPNSEATQGTIPSEIVALLGEIGREAVGVLRGIRTPAAVHALGRIGLAALPTLLELDQSCPEDDGSGLRSALVGALTTLGKEVNLPARDRQTVIAALRQHALGSKPRIAWEAAAGLGQMGEAGQTVLLALVRDPDGRIRQRGLFGLSHYQRDDPVAVEAVRGRLADEDAAVRDLAGEILERWNGRERKDPRNGMASWSPDPMTVSGRLALVLAGGGNRICRTVEQDLPWLLESGLLVSLLRQALKERAPAVRSAAVVVLLRLERYPEGDRESFEWVLPLGPFQGEIRNNLPPVSQRLLAGAIRNPDAGVRRAAASWLLQLQAPSPETLDGLRHAVCDTHADVRTSAVTVLARLGKPGLAVLIEALPFTAESHIENALATMPVADVPTLTEALERTVPEGRSVLLALLARKSDDARANKALRAAVADPDRQVRRTAAVLLAKRWPAICTLADVEWVFPLFDDPELLAGSVGELLTTAVLRNHDVRLSRRVVEELVEALASRDPAMVLAAAGMLEKLQGHAAPALPALLALLKRPIAEKCRDACHEAAGGIASDSRTSLTAAARVVNAVLARHPRGEAERSRVIALVRLLRRADLPGNQRARIAKALMPVLQDGSGEIRVVVLGELRKLGPRFHALVPRPVPGLDDPNRMVQQEAVELAWAIEPDSDEPWPAFLELLHHGLDFSLIRPSLIEVLRARGEALERPAAGQVRAFLLQNRHVYAGLLPGLGPAGRAILPGLFEKVAEGCPVSGNIITRLAAEASLADGVRPYLRSENFAVRTAAFAAMGKIGSPAVMELQRLLGEEGPAVWDAIHTLAGLGPAAGTAVPAMRARLRTAEGGLKAALEQALKKIEGGG